MSEQSVAPEVAKADVSTEVPTTSQGEDAPVAEEETQSSSRSRFWRIGAIVLLFGGIWIGAQFVDTSLLSDPEAMQAVMADAGLLGILAFLAVFSLGQMAQLPGLPFVLAARFAYGPVLGFAASYVAALLAVTSTFLVVRAIGGGALQNLKWRWVQKAFAKMEEKPFRTVAVLRAFFALSPPLNYALAMSPVRCRQHFVASSVGLLVPISLWILLADVLVRWLA